MFFANNEKRSMVFVIEHIIYRVNMMHFHHDENNKSYIIIQQSTTQLRVEKYLHESLPKSSVFRVNPITIGYILNTKSSFSQNHVIL